MLVDIQRSPEWFATAFALFVLGACAWMYVVRTSDHFQLKCIVSTVDGNKYCVRDRERIAEAADLLARTAQRCADLVQLLVDKYPEEANVQRLQTRFDREKIVETLPTSEHTAYSENKGEKIAFCLNEETDQDSSPLIDENTLMFVALHELAHVASESIGHKAEFWDNFKFLLENAKAAGLYVPVDYKAQPQKYCGMKITDNPYYDR